MRFLPALLLCAFLALATGKTAHGQPASSDKTEGGFSFSRIFDPRTSPFIPIPEIGTDPNSGTTFGLLPVFLSTNPEGHISRIIAPDIIYTPGLRYGGHFRMFSYPSDDRQWHVVVGAKQRIERELDVTYAAGLTRQSPLSLSGSVIYDRSATERFFGFGNHSPLGDETNYTNEQEYVDAVFGWNLDPHLQIGYDLRPRVIQIERGTFGHLPSIEARFPQLSGLGDEHELLNRLFIAYDTRDSAAIPTRGGEIVGFVGHADRDLLSSVTYSFFGLDARRFIPLGERFILAGHAALRYMPGDTAPFWAQSSLGGDRSVIGDRQLLRGFGSDRFIDRNSFSASIELRSHVFDLDLFSTRVTLELAPFIDTGRVFHNLNDNPVSHLHTVEGLGVRALASPFIVGYVDIGYGSEGTAVFSGIDYAF
ncbi:MAG TPA: BamA/TamA family outer membrane protein [Stellaceae bacterium]|nr:BamA/TamA family outer membrane protein [Stellaceae bacterium]